MKTLVEIRHRCVFWRNSCHLGTFSLSESSVKLKGNIGSVDMKLWLLVIGVFFAALACASSVPAAPPLPPPTPDPLNRIPDLQARMAQTKNYNKFVVDEEVVVWFSPCEPVPASWVATMIGYDLPSASAIYFNNDGTVKSSPRPNFESEEARVRLEALAANSDLMGQIISARTAPGRCPEEFR